jgi:hypothetical protein
VDEATGGRVTRPGLTGSGGAAIVPGFLPPPSLSSPGGGVVDCEEGAGLRAQRGKRRKTP